MQGPRAGQLGVLEIQRASRLDSVYCLSLGLDYCSYRSVPRVGQFLVAILIGMYAIVGVRLGIEAAIAVHDGYGRIGR
jgi:hypothetical protein